MLPIFAGSRSIGMTLALTRSVSRQEPYDRARPLDVSDANDLAGSQVGRLPSKMVLTTCQGSGYLQVLQSGIIDSCYLSSPGLPVHRHDVGADAVRVATGTL